MWFVNPYWFARATPIRYRIGHSSLVPVQAPSRRLVLPLPRARLLVTPLMFGGSVLGEHGARSRTPLSLGSPRPHERPKATTPAPTREVAGIAVVRPVIVAGDLDRRAVDHRGQVLAGGA
jgi:hypothetical protein